MTSYVARIISIRPANRGWYTVSNDAGYLFHVTPTEAPHIHVGAVVEVTFNRLNRVVRIAVHGDVIRNLAPDQVEAFFRQRF